jgi:hypothetical protein
MCAYAIREIDCFVFLAATCLLRCAASQNNRTAAAVQCLQLRHEAAQHKPSNFTCSLTVPALPPCPTDDAVTSLLVAELSLFLLMFSEGANLRHLPEAMCFFYWTMRTCPTFSACLPGLPSLVPCLTSNEPDHDLRSDLCHLLTAQAADCSSVCDVLPYIMRVTFWQPVAIARVD